MRDAALLAVAGRRLTPEAQALAAATAVWALLDDRVQAPSGAEPAPPQAPQ